MNEFVRLIVTVAILLAACIIADHFSPHPLLTQLVKIALFVIALIVVVSMVLPMAGVRF